MNRSLNIFRKSILPAILNSYSVIFFFNKPLTGAILLIVTFFNFQAGLSGLIAVLVSVMIARSMGFDEIRINQGIYSFNSLLTGLGMGTFFELGLTFFFLLILAVLFCLMISVILSGWFGKYDLPFLSIPFVISFWIILLPSNQFANLGLTQRNIFWMNEMYSIGGKHLLDFFQTIENLPLNKMVIIFLRSLSSIIFQDNILSGILIAAAILISSRIAFLLSVTGFVTAYLFAWIVGSDMAGFSFYNIGANYILVAIAAGGFFTIPSRYSFLWVIILIPLTLLLILFMTKLMAFFQLPIFSLPFSLIVIAFVWFLILRIKPGKLILTPYQYYSPEVNLYTYSGNSSRLAGSSFFPIHLPFWGEWKVSQGYNGKFTHKGDWGNAVDFVLTDDMDRTHEGSSGSCEDYFCYNKPVLAPADGVVAELVDHIDDNEPGKVNSSQNWGNTIIIKHLNNLHTQMSHLRPGTLRVKKDDFVRKGEIIGLCGNSGRSPEPHLHFQVQSTPLPGSRTLSYPFAYYLLKTSEGFKLNSFSIPSEGDMISNVITSNLLKKAFDLQPGMIIKFKYRINDDEERTVSWEVYTDVYNNRYLYCSESQSTSHFINDGTMFYFTSFYGDRKSLLYFFYLSSYKVLLGYYNDINITDLFPLHIVARNRFSLWLHDFIAPFHQYMKAGYTETAVWADSHVDPSEVRLSSEMYLTTFSSVRRAGSGKILLSAERINEFTFESGKLKIWAQRI